MRISRKYQVAGEYFSFICDASEWSWQLCRKFIDQSGEANNLVIRKIDDFSYGVVDTTLSQFIHAEIVSFLI